MNYEDIIALWREKYQYIHTDKHKKAVICSEKQYLDNWKKCFSPYCKDHACRWSQKHMEKMLKVNPTYKITRLILHIGVPIPPKILQQIIKNYFKRLRRQYNPLEYYWALEYDEGLHLHVLVASKETLDDDFIRIKWQKTLEKKEIKVGLKSTRVLAVYDLPGIANYNTKETNWNPAMQRPPKGLYRNLAYPSNGWGKLFPNNNKNQETI